MTGRELLPIDERIELRRLADTQHRTWRQHISQCPACTEDRAGCVGGEEFRRIWEATRDAADPPRGVPGGNQPVRCSTIS